MIDLDEGVFVDIDRGAHFVVPRMLRLGPPIRSVVDICCGSGEWLAQFQESGIEDTEGFVLARSEPLPLRVDAGRFRPIEGGRLPDVGRRFDLCLSTRLGAIVEPAAAETLVDDCCRLADAVAFLAPLPGQLWPQAAHECWPSTWADLFAVRNYACFDVFRPAFWNDSRVHWSIAQGLLLFINRTRHDLVAGMTVAPSANLGRLDVVHPRQFEAVQKARMAAESAAVYGVDPEREADLRHEVATLRQAIEDIRQSTSWKVTGPLRWIARLRG